VSSADEAVARAILYREYKARIVFGAVMLPVVLVAGLLTAWGGSTLAVPPASEVFYLTDGPDYRKIDARDFWDRVKRHDCIKTAATVYDEQPPIVEFHCEG
jgi:hypothetical protein